MNIYIMQKYQSILKCTVFIGALLVSNLLLSQGPVITVDDSLNACANTNNGRATIRINGGTPPYTIKVSLGNTNIPVPNQNPFTLNNLARGKYQISVTDARKFTATRSVFIESFGVTYDTTIANTCFGSSDGYFIYKVRGTPPFRVTIRNTRTNQITTYVSPSDSIVTPGIFPSGQYTVTITDSRREAPCTRTFNNIRIDDALTGLTLSTSVLRSPCNSMSQTGVASVNINGGLSPYTVRWSNGETTETARRLSAGTYTVTVTDAKGCTSTNSIKLVATSISLRLNTTDTTIEAGLPLVLRLLDRQIGVVYTIDGRKFTSDTVMILNPETKSYTIRATLDGCQPQEITVNAKVSSSICTYLPSQDSLIPNNEFNNIICDPELKVDVIDVQNAEYVWTPESARDFIKSSVINGKKRFYISRNVVPKGSASITLYLKLDDKEKNCTIVDSLPIRVDTTWKDLNVKIGSIKHVSTCNGKDGSISLDVSGGFNRYKYSWSDNRYINSPNRTGLKAGTYTCTISDIDYNDCTTTISVTITQPNSGGMAIPVIRSTPDRPSGTLTICGTGPSYLLTVENYDAAGTEFLWSNGESDRSIIARRADTFTVTVRNACGESKSADYVIRGGDLPAKPDVKGPVRRVVGQKVYCEISSSISDANTYNFQWFKGDTLLQGATAATYNIIQDGNYSVRITDKTTGCENTSDRRYIISECKPQVSPSAICAGEQITVTLYGINLPPNTSYAVFLSDATGSFTNPKLLDTTSTSPKFTLPSDIPAGNKYRIKIKIKINAPDTVSISDHFSIYKPNKPVLHKKQVNDTSATLTITNYVKSQIYTWRKDNIPLKVASQSEQTITVRESGKYVVIMKDSNGCTAISDTQVVTLQYTPEPIPATPPKTLKGGGLNIYPNPFTDSLQIRINAAVSESLSMRIIDTKGVPVYSITLKTEKGKPLTHTLTGAEVERLAAGIYILEIDARVTIDRIRILKLD